MKVHKWLFCLAPFLSLSSYAHRFGQAYFESVGNRAMAEFCASVCTAQLFVLPFVLLGAGIGKSEDW